MSVDAPAARRKTRSYAEHRMTTEERGLHLFGYVRPFKPDLKIREFDTYQGIYCGLCKTIGREYGQLVRLSLSYDFAFFSALSLAVSEEPLRFERQHCVMHPVRKRACLCGGGDLSFPAGAAVAMLYYKWKDNLADSGAFRRFFLRPLGLPIARAYRKAVRRFPKLKEIMEGTLAKQEEAERFPGCTVDRAADASSRALGLLFQELTGDEKQGKVLYRFGFLLGRWIYLTDAVDDLEEDRKKGTFNPLILWAKREGIPDGQQKERIRRRAEELINVTYAEMTLAYELIELKRYGSILENILYEGLPSVKEEIWSDRREK